MATFKRILNLENYIFTFFILFVFYGAINSPYSLVKILLGKPKHLLVLLPLLIIGSYTRNTDRLFVII
jgi:hypothetical protein